MTDTFLDQLKACLLGGLIGDAIGSYFENSSQAYLSPSQYSWQITDDTQLSIATCQAIIHDNLQVNPATIAQHFLHWFQQKKLTGIGSSTLGALQGLQVGGHWALVGRSGEYAAGNGAAMRIAPLAFVLTGEFDRHLIRDVVTITHKNDEAYCGALAIFFALKAAQQQLTAIELIKFLEDQLPDSATRDRLITIKTTQFSSTCTTIAQQYGNSGYVVESVPLAIYAACRGTLIGMEAMMEELCIAGGDTDTNCSMAGQILGAWLGIQAIPTHFQEKANPLVAYRWIEDIILQWEKRKEK